MSTQEFEDQLRQYLRREPFQPFEVELYDGRVIEVLEPKLVIGGGAATFLTGSCDFVEFACEEVQEFRLLHEARR